MKKQISRRDFLKNAAAGSAALGAIAALGVASAAENEAGSLVFNMPETWDMETGFLVIGTGTAIAGRSGPQMRGGM